MSSHAAFRFRRTLLHRPRSVASTEQVSETLMSSGVVSLPPSHPLFGQESRVAAVLIAGRGDYWRNR